MSKLIVAQHRAPPDPAVVARRMRRTLEEITPDIAREGARHGIESRGSLILGTLNLPATALRRGMSLCQGMIYGPAEGWSEPGAPFPDGSYVLVRDGERLLEVVSDPAASRSLWYYLDDEVFVASNSQRAVTLYVGRFDFEPAVVPWLLASGTIGPGLSYNRHLAVLPAGSSVLLDKVAWTLRRQGSEIRFEPSPRPWKEQAAALAAALDATVGSFTEEDAPRSFLALSGGADSRAIGALLVRHRPGARWRSFTGGPVEALETPGTDACVAAQVAARLGTEHHFIANRVSSEPVETVVDRFVLASEGRVDHLGGYLDGLGQFRTLVEAGAETIIRGDTCFGGPVFTPAESGLAMRRTISLLLCGEVTTLQPYLAAAGLGDHALPPLLHRREGESLLTWRDRLYLQFRAACVLSALTETKAAFVEVVNPLLSRRSIEVACALPDAMRLDKALFREVAGSFVPALPHVSDIGGRKMADVLRQPGVRRQLAASLEAPSASEIFGERLTRWVHREIDVRRHARARIQGTIAHLPFWHGRAAVDEGPAVHPLRLAFRMHMARTMVDRLRADAALLCPSGAVCGPMRSSA